ncbi:MAG TPA: type I-U CRISPR-associated protein Csb2 [Xanthobacteraceae bacterium]|jgi:CRISPR-associated protein Csb2|nr:type I-U CRISPR-associated protein Csb2 [Xanthobacteraceae bacterium]
MEHRDIRAAQPPEAGTQGFRWAVDGDSPSITAAIRVGEAVRAAVFRRAERHGLMPLPDWFHRSGGPRHSHAVWLSEDADQDGRIDHVALFCENGLPPGLMPVLSGGIDVWLGAHGRFRLAPVWLGRRDGSAWFGPARAWESVTPYVAPRWRKARKSGRERAAERPERQISDELARRGLSGLLEIYAGAGVRCGDGFIPAAQFRRDLSMHRPPADATPLALRLLFDRPVWGPLTLGFGAHFGLGLLAPADRLLDTGLWG